MSTSVCQSCGVKLESMDRVLDVRLVTHPGNVNRNLSTDRTHPREYVHVKCPEAS